MLLCVRSAGLLIVGHVLRRRFAHFKLGAHFLELRCLLPQTCGESFDFVVLLRVGRFLPLMGKEWGPGKRAFC